MATPIYKGKPNAIASSGWLSGLGSWFGGSAPAYTGNQSTSGSSGFFGGATPAYKPAPAPIDGAGFAPEAIAAAAAPECPSEPERITVLIPREFIESQQ